MKPILRRMLLHHAGLLLIGTLSVALADDKEHSPESRTAFDSLFISENNAAMEKMMAGMDAPPTGNVDRDFVTQMIAHHQGAIDMAMTLLKYGQNEQLKRIAQEIIIEQQQEIGAMYLAIGDPLPVSQPAPTQMPNAGHP